MGDSHTGFYRGCATSVYLFNRETGKRVRVIDNPERADHVGRHYHIDPHPRFVCNDQYVVFTTTIRGEIDLAIVPVAHLVEMTTS